MNDNKKSKIDNTSTNDDTNSHLFINKNSQASNLNADELLA
jgi:hypothetical protein